MKERLMQQSPGGDLQEICYTDNRASIRWEEEGEEFSWNNQLYDVAKTVVRNGKTWLLCLADGREETLLRQMCAASQHNEKKSGQQGMTPIADDYTLPTGILITNNYIIIPRRYPAYIARLQQPAIPVIVPPPRG